MKRAFGLLLVLAALLGFMLLVISTSNYMSERNAPPVVPSAYLTAAGEAALGQDEGPSPDEMERLAAIRERIHERIRENRSARGM